MIAPEGADPVEFNWCCEKGPSDNIKKLKEEFCEENLLKPITIFVTGPPLSGKSYYSAQLSEQYNIPHVTLKPLIEKLETIDSGSDLGKEMKEFKEKNPEDRYPDDLLWKIVSKRLNENDCQHRGFVLDGFPRTY